MSFLKYIVAIIIIFVSTTYVSAQRRYMYNVLISDSTKCIINEIIDNKGYDKGKQKIEQLLHQEKDYKKQVGLICRLYDIYRIINDRDGQKKCLEEIEKKGNEHNDERVRVQVILLSAQEYFSQHNPEKGFEIYKKSIDYYKKQNNPICLSNLYSFTGIAYMRLSAMYAATKNFLLAVETAEKSRDPKLMSRVYYDISELYLKQNNPGKALSYAIPAYDIFTQLNEKENSGMCCTRLGEIYKMKKMYPEAKFYFEKAFFLLEPSGNKLLIAQALNGLGDVYLFVGQHNSALNYYKKALHKRKLAGYKQEIADSYLSLGKYYNARSDIDSAKYYLKKALEVAKGSSSYYPAMETAEILRDIATINEDYKEGCMFHKILSHYKDSVNQIFNINKYSQAETDFNYERDRQSAIESSERQAEEIFRSRRNTVIAVIVSITITLLLIYTVRLYGKQTNYNLKLQAQKNEIQNQSLKLRQQNIQLEKLSAIADKIQNGIVIINKKGVMEWINKGLITMLLPQEKSGPEKYIYKHAEVLFSKETIAQFKQMYDDMLPRSIEVKRDKQRYFQVSLTPYDYEKKDEHVLICVFTDITRQKAIEEEMSRNKRELEMQTELMSVINAELSVQKTAVSDQNNELRMHKEELMLQTEHLEAVNKELEKLSIVARQTDNSIFVTDINGNITWVNEAFTKHSGYGIEEYLNEHDSNILKASANPDIKNAFNTVKQTKQSVTYSFETKTKNGSSIWLQTNLTPAIDEFGNISQIIAVCSDITTIVQAERKIAEQNKEITESMEYARRIQDALQPMNVFMETVFSDYFVISMPKNIVSGDFHWVGYKNNHTIFALADCTGHGIPGSFMSMLAIVTLENTVSSLTDFKASTVLNNLRSKIIKLLHQHGKTGEAQDGLDISICILNNENHILEYAGAYSFTYIIKNGTPDNELKNYLLKQNCRITTNEENKRYLICMKPDKMPIGIHSRDTIPFNNIEIQIEKGDRVYMSSDGYCDQFGGPKGKKFFSANFEKMLLQISNLDLKQQQQKITDVFTTWKGNCEQVDDVHVMCVEL